MERESMSDNRKKEIMGKIESKYESKKMQPGYSDTESGCQ